MKRVVFFYLFLVTVSALSAQEVDSIIDIRDGQKYGIVKIGNQWWMAENLRAIRYTDGTPLFAGTGAGDISSESSTKYYFWLDDDSTSNAETYGALYTWTAAMNAASSSNTNPSEVQGVCPSGWHLPSDAEWTELIDYLGGSSEAGGKLKEIGTSHWLNPNTGATNESGFTSLPGGIRYFNGTFNSTSGYWWSATEDDSDLAFDRVMGYDIATVSTQGENKLSGISVRCIMDPCSLHNLIISKNDATCHGSTDGDIDLTVSDPGSYDFLWSTGDTTEDISNLAAGWYKVTVTAGLGCTMSDSIEVNEPNPIITRVERENWIRCFGGNDGAFIVDAKGGVLPHIFQWENRPFSYDSIEWGFYADTVYHVTVFDQNNCTAVDSGILTQPPKVQTGNITGKTEVSADELLIYYVPETVGSIYQWDVIGGSVISGQTSNLVYIEWADTANGLISVIETTDRGCNGDTVYLAVNIGPNDIPSTEANKFKVFPNPGRNKITIEFPNLDHQTFQFLLTDLSGKVLKIIDNITEDKIEINREGLQHGLYLIEIRGPRIYRSKILIE